MTRLKKCKKKNQGDEIGWNENVQFGVSKNFFLTWKLKIWGGIFFPSRLKNDAGAACCKKWKIATFRPQLHWPFLATLKLHVFPLEGKKSRTQILQTMPKKKSKYENFSGCKIKCQDSRNKRQKILKNTFHKHKRKRTPQIFSFFGHSVPVHTIKEMSPVRTRSWTGGVRKPPFSMGIKDEIVSEMSLAPTRMFRGESPNTSLQFWNGWVCLFAGHHVPGHKIREMSLARTRMVSRESQKTSL